MKKNDLSYKEIVSILKKGGVGVMPTDTIYGLVALAKNKRAVKRIYRLKKRTKKKSAVVLISRLSQLKFFPLKITKEEKEILKKIWPSKISVSLACPANTFEYLHAGRKRFAFRLPGNLFLRKIIDETGPLLATSANFQDLPPARNIKEARNYFQDKVDFYIEGKLKSSLPSTLIEIKGKSIIVHRKGQDFQKIKKIKNYTIKNYG